MSVPVPAPASPCVSNVCVFAYAFVCVRACVCRIYDEQQILRDLPLGLRKELSVELFSVRAAAYLFCAFSALLLCVCVCVRARASMRACTCACVCKG